MRNWKPVPPEKIEHGLFLATTMSLDEAATLSGCSRATLSFSKRHGRDFGPGPDVHMRGTWANVRAWYVSPRWEWLLTADGQEIDGGDVQTRTEARALCREVLGIAEVAGSFDGYWAAIEDGALAVGPMPKGEDDD